MALLFADGFDIYADAADVLKGQWYRENAGNQTFSASNGRYSGGCIQNTVSTNGWHLGVGSIPNATTIFIAFHYYCVTNTGNGADDAILQGFSQSGNSLFKIGTNSSGDLRAYAQGVTTTTTVGTSAAAFSNATWHWVEVKIVLGTTNTDGEITVQVNGTQLINATGIDTFLNSTATGRLESFGFYGGTGDCRFDDVIIYDSTGSHMNNFLGETKIETIIPNGDGSTLDWTASGGTDFSTVDDGIGVADDDTTYLSSSTATDVTELQMSNLSNNPTQIHGVQVRTRSRKEDAGARTYRTYAKSGASTENGITLGLTTAYCWRRNGVHYVDPNTSIAWTGSGVNGMHVGLELLS